MRITLILFSVLLASCSYLSVPVLSPYKMDIRQGNFVTPEMRGKLKLGMTKQQVRYVLGTPMINDAFHGNRWDYVYRLEQHGKLVEKQHLALYFNGENLARIDDIDQPAPVAAEQPVVPVAPVVAAAPVVAVAPAVEPVAAPAIAKAPEPQPVVEVAEPQPVQLQPVPQAPQPQPVVAVADVQKSVQGWVTAWSSRDVASYLASYADTFKPDGMSKAAWEAQRRERIGKAKSIVLEVSDLNIKLQDDHHASADFRQGYRSDSYRDSTYKTLQLEKIGGKWLIVSELARKK